MGEKEPKNGKEVGEKRKMGRGFGEKEEGFWESQEELEDNILLEKQLVFFSVIISLEGSSCLSSKNSYAHLVLRSSNFFFFFQPSFVDINTSSNKFLHNILLIMLIRVH